LRLKAFRTPNGHVETTNLHNNCLIGLLYSKLSQINSCRKKKEKRKGEGEEGRVRVLALRVVRGQNRKRNLILGSPSIKWKRV
jgi:hypothetical protein